MCNNICSWLCCCCPCLCPKQESQTRDLSKFAKNLEKKYAKRGGKSSYSTVKYGTNWETLVQQVQTPSQIQDLMVTKDVNVDKNRYKTREDIYKFILKDYEFSLENRLGKGGYGEVFKIKEKGPSGVWRAVKIMKLKGDTDLSRHRFDMFKTEIFALRKTPHKNIIRLLDHSMASNLYICFIIMEYAEGGDLMKRLRTQYKVTNKGFPQEEAKTYFVQIANAVHWVHSQKLIHGDLKLENILIVKQNNTEIIKVTDFGCARVAYREGEGVVKVTRAVGTIAYMSPEQLRVYICVNLKRPDLIRKPTHNYNPIRADVWSLGVCLYRMLFYDSPFVFDSKNELQSILKMINAMKKGPEIPDGYDIRDMIDIPHLLKELLEYNKDRRVHMKEVMASKWIYDSPLLDKPKK